MDIDNSIIDSMVELLETITDEKIDLSCEIQNSPDFSSFLKEKASTELGGHIPQKSTVDGVEYCMNSDFVKRFLEAF